jgi:uncharacterized protein YbjT (DUF2867 family)
MRVLVSAAGPFVGAHVDATLRRNGHTPVTAGPLAEGGASEVFRARTSRSLSIDAVIHLSPDATRAMLDLAFAIHARLFVFLSSVGADPTSRVPALRSRGRAEELVRAAGLPWIIVRPEILWGPGDVFTTSLSDLLRHLPFIPIPRSQRMLAPVHIDDAAHALVAGLDRPPTDDAPREWSLVGPERLAYAEVIERVAIAMGVGHRHRLRVPAWSVRLGAALEERLAHQPKVTRALLDRLVAELPGPENHPVLDLPRRPMSVEALRSSLEESRALAAGRPPVIL